MTSGLVADKGRSPYLSRSRINTCSDASSPSNEFLLGTTGYSKDIPEIKVEPLSSVANKVAPFVPTHTKPTTGGHAGRQFQPSDYVLRRAQLLA